MLLLACAMIASPLAQADRAVASVASAQHATGALADASAAAMNPESAAMRLAAARISYEAVIAPQPMAGPEAGSSSAVTGTGVQPAGAAAPPPAAAPIAATPAPAPTPTSGALADTAPAVPVSGMAGVTPTAPDAPSPAAAAADITVASDAPTADGGADPAALRDPSEARNRKIFAFDLALDRISLGPVTHVYMAVVPRVLRDHIGHAVNNLNEPLVALNDLLQRHPGLMLHTLVRFVVNSTIGIGGLFDVAGKTGLPHHASDFGQTLARYGVHPGPYVVLPLFGPSDVRDTFGLIVDNFADPISFLIGGITSTGGITRAGVQIIDDRVQIDPLMRASRDVTDLYATARSAYGQRRAALVQRTTGKTAALPDFGPAAQ